MVEGYNSSEQRGVTVSEMGNARLVSSLGSVVPGLPVRSINEFLEGPSNYNSRVFGCEFPPRSYKLRLCTRLPTK